jgi:hypothetical protein
MLATVFASAGCRLLVAPTRRDYFTLASHYVVKAG